MKQTAVLKTHGLGGKFTLSLIGTGISIFFSVLSMLVNSKNSSCSTFKAKTNLALRQRFGCCTLPQKGNSMFYFGTNLPACEDQLSAVHSLISLDEKGNARPNSQRAILGTLSSLVRG